MKPKEMTQMLASLDEHVAKLGAMVTAQGEFIGALYDAHPDKPAVLARFQQMARLVAEISLDSPASDEAIANVATARRLFLAGITGEQAGNA